MNELLLAICLLFPFSTSSVDLEENQHVAVYQYEVQDGYIYLDDEGFEVFIDENTLNEVGATTEQPLLITFNEYWEVEYIEAIEQ